MAKTYWIQIEAQLEWAKLFYDIRDRNSTDRKVQKMLDKHDGQYSVSVIPTTQEDLDKVKEYLSEKVYGGNPRFKTNADGKEFFVIKRKHTDIKEFRDKKTGELSEVELGGEPEIVWWNEEKGYGTPFDKDVDGFIGNGSKAVIKFTMYGDLQDDGATVRLEKVGIIDLVPYSGGQGGRF